MSQLTLYLFGPPRLEMDGNPIHLPRRKALALLAYLAVSGQEHSRDRLATWQLCCGPKTIKAVRALNCAAPFRCSTARWGRAG